MREGSGRMKHERRENKGRVREMIVMSGTHLELACSGVVLLRRCVTQSHACVRARSCVRSHALYLHQS